MKRARRITSATALAFVALAALPARAQYPKIDLATGYEADPRWPQKPSGFQWGDVPGVAVDAEGNIWMFHRGDLPVQVYRRDGSFLRAWEQGQITRAHHIEIDPQGNVWLADVELTRRAQVYARREAAVDPGHPR